MRFFSTHHVLEDGGAAGVHQGAVEVVGDGDVAHLHRAAGDDERRLVGRADLLEEDLLGAAADERHRVVHHQVVGVVAGLQGDDRPGRRGGERAGEGGEVGRVELRGSEARVHEVGGVGGERRGAVADGLAAGLAERGAGGAGAAGVGEHLHAAPAVGRGREAVGAGGWAPPARRWWSRAWGACRGRRARRAARRRRPARSPRGRSRRGTWRGPRVHRRGSRRRSDAAGRQATAGAAHHEGAPPRRPHRTGSVLSTSSVAPGRW